MPTPAQSRPARSGPAPSEPARSGPAPSEAAPLEAYVRDFGAGRFFEAHEDLEGLWWRRDSDPFLQGLILFAAAFLQARRGKAVGAARHFRAAARHLAPFAPLHLGLDVAAVLAHAEGAAARLEALPAGGVAPADLAALVPPFSLAWSLPSPEELALEAEARRAASGGQAALAAAVGAALAERAASGGAGRPAVPAWAEVVREVTRRTGGAFPRVAVRQAVRAALGGPGEGAEPNPREPRDHQG